MPRTIVIGTGISAVAYLATVRSPLGDVDVTGGRDLWHQMPKKHAMGQPEALLTGNVLRGERGFGAPPVAGKIPFLTAERFASMLDMELRARSSAHVPGSIVTSVSRTHSGYMVEGTVAGDQFFSLCDRVIVAVGPGPSRALTTTVEGSKLPQGVASFGGRVVGGTEFMSPEWRPPEGLPRRPRIVVNGGSATAAWVVEQAQMRDMELVLWFTREGNSNFDGAFPPGERNTAIELHTRSLRVYGVLEGVEQRGADSPLRLRFAVDGSSSSSPSAPAILEADLLVYALGGAHTRHSGIPEIVSASLQKELVAYYDHNRAISETASLLAFGTEDRSLMIVGSAMCSQAGFGNLATMAVRHSEKLNLGLLQSYTEIGKTLPPAARPPEGIAMVIAGIEALTDYIPATAVPGHTAQYFSASGGVTQHATRFNWNINVNTSNRTQLAVWLTDTNRIDPLAVQLSTALIIKFRTGRPLGLSRQEVDHIVGVTDGWVRVHRLTDTLMNDKQLSWDKLAQEGDFIRTLTALLAAELTPARL